MKVLERPVVAESVDEEYQGADLDTLTPEDWHYTSDHDSTPDFLEGHLIQSERARENHSDARVL